MAWKKHSKQLYSNSYTYSMCSLHRKKSGWGILCSLKAEPFGTGSASNEARSSASTLKTAKSKAAKLAKDLQKKRARYYSIRD